MDLSAVNTLAELERIGWAFDFAGEDQLKVKCPFHDDQHPSCSVDITKQVFKCHTAGCERGGDILTFFAKSLKTTRRVVFEDFSKRYELNADKIIDAKLVERYHKAIWGAKPLLKELYERGVTDGIIRSARLGYHAARITIPILNRSGLVVNLRRYSPGGCQGKKFSSSSNRGNCRLFPVDQLKYDTLVVCGGELKALVAADRLNQFDIGAVTTTTGEGSWLPAFNQEFVGKQVYVCFDIDPAGEKAADKICRLLSQPARWVGKVDLPLDLDKYPHGDVNDWIGHENATAEDFKQLLENTTEWEPFVKVEEPQEVKTLSLIESVQAKYTGKRIRVEGIVSSMDTSPYVIPRLVGVQCDRSQENCSLCSVVYTKQDEYKISPESVAVLDMIGTPKKEQRAAIMEALRIPRCKVVEFQVREWFNVQDIRLSPQLNITERSADSILQPAMCVGTDCELNTPYEFTGRMYPHPKTQQVVILASEHIATQDALSTYKVDSNGLKVFQPGHWTEQSIQEKLDHIYEDFENNVTRIHQRQDLHLVMDLSWHSVLLLNLDGKPMRGWVESLILGDSSQGKSETSNKLSEHYGLGEKVVCKSATVAGLLGGLQQTGNRWFVTWGIIPMHDKRLVILEELKGASTEIIGKLTDMRSSGVAEIPKIEKRRTHARTRIIALSNSRSGHPLSTYNYGIEAIKELVGSLEDVRRFDIGLILSQDEIDPDAIHQWQQTKPRETPYYSGDTCRKCVLWAWTRREDQIRFENYNLLLDESTRLCKLFTELIPIVDKGSMRHKLARLSAALAARTFSTNDGETLSVRSCHVRYVSKLLERLYSSSVFGYLDYTAAINATQTLIDPDLIKHKIGETPFPADLVRQLLDTNEMNLFDIMDWCGWDMGEARCLLSSLVRKNALHREGRAYRKTAAFITLLKSLKVANRPSWIGESDEF